MTFIAENIAALKQEYGSSLQLGYVSYGAFDPITGRQASTTKEITIDLAIRLPNQMSLQFLQSIGAGIKALEILVGTAQILIDLADVPTGFDLRAEKAFAVYNNRKYSVTKADIYDEAAILWVKDVGAPEPFNKPTPDRLTFSHSISTTVT